jgi:hypothetical protein
MSVGRRRDAASTSAAEAIVYQDTPIIGQFQTATPTS